MSQQDDRLTATQAAVLRAQREGRGYSQQYAASLIGFSREWFNKIEKRQAPIGQSDRRLLARALGFSPSLLGVTGGGIIPLPAGNMVRVLWDQFYGGTSPSLLALVPYAQLWLDEQPRESGPDSGIISQLYQAVATALRDAGLLDGAMDAANSGVLFAEHLSGPREPNPDAATAYYRRARVYAAMAAQARGDRRAELLSLALADATIAVRRAPEDRVVLRVVTLQSLAGVQAQAKVAPADTITTIHQAISLARGIRRPMRDATGFVYSPSGLYHSTAQTYVFLAEDYPGRGYLESAEDQIIDAVSELGGGDYRWTVDMQLTQMDVAARQGNMRDAANIAPQIAGALGIHQSRMIGARALCVMQRIRLPRNNRTALENLAAARAQVTQMLSQVGSTAV